MLCWVGSSSVKYDSLPNSIGKYQLQPRVRLDTHHFHIQEIQRHLQLSVPFFLAELLTVFRNYSRVTINPLLHDLFYNLPSK